MEKKNIAIAVFATAAIVLAGFAFKNPQVITNTIEKQLGANPGPTFLCTSALFNPGLIDVDSNSTTSVSVPGAERGDVLYATFGTSTAAGVQSVDKYSVTANVSSTGNIIVAVNSLASTSLNLSTGTVMACYSKSYIK